MDPLIRNVSVVVLNYNRAATTITCVDHLQDTVGDHLKEVLVVDNGSAPHELSQLRDGLADRTRLVPVGANRYFGEGNNIGVEEASGEFIVLMNNDVFVEPEWLTHLAHTWNADDTVAGVGPMFLYPDGRVQEVGGMVLETGDTVQIGKGAAWPPDHYTEVCTVDYCSAACLLLRRQDFLDIGGFSYQWEPAYYEDVDLCFELWSRYGRVVVNPKARVVHLESHTTTERQLGLGTIVDINRLKFNEKWGDWLKDRKNLYVFGHGGASLPKAPPSAGRSPTPHPHPQTHRSPQPRAVLYAPYELVPGGGERVLFELAAHFAQLYGHERVALSSPHRYSELRIRQLAAAFGHGEPLAHPRTLDTIDVDEVEVAVVLGNQVVPPERAFGRHCVYLCQFPFSVRDSYIEERSTWLDDYAEIWVYSDFVRTYVHGMVQLLGISAPPIRVLYPPATLTARAHPLPWQDRTSLLAVGRFFKGDHDKRQDIVLLAASRLARQLGRTVEVALAGSLHTTIESRERFLELRQLATELDGISCTFYPNASLARLAQLYARSSVLIHPTGYDSDVDEFPERFEHFGIAPVEAATAGCIPVALDAAGPAEVLQLLGCPTTFTSLDHCVAVVKQLWDDPGGSTVLSEELTRRVAMFSPEAFHNRVRDALAGRPC